LLLAAATVITSCDTNVDNRSGSDKIIAAKKSD
jgi:hypothetical protein